MKNENTLISKEFILKVRVYYEDTDAGGFVYHANYLKYLDRARTEWLRAIGIEQTQLHEQYKLVFVVRQISINYLKPIFLNELINVTSSLIQIGKASMIFTQRILRNADVVCTAEVKIAALNIIKQRPQALPPEIIQTITTQTEFHK
jgi:acyl-CoA thioester hydrolase